MSLQTKPDIHGQNKRIAPEKNERRKRKRKTRDEEEATYILDDLRSGDRVLYVPSRSPQSQSQSLPGLGRHAQDSRRRTREPIIRSYYRFALKGGTNLYGGERVKYYHISCFGRIIPDLADLVRGEYLKMDGWIAGPPDSKVTIESSTKAIQDWFRYEGCAFDIDCYERHKKDHDEWERAWSILQIEHQLAHTGKPSDGCCLCEGVPEPKEPKEMNYFPENSSAVWLSRLSAIVSGQPHIDKWWRWRNSEMDV